MTDPTSRSASCQDDRLRVELLYPPALYYALVHNRVPIAQHLRVENLTDVDLPEIVVSAELVGPDGPLAEPWRRQVDVLPAAGTVAWSELDDFTADTAALRHTDEAFPVEYRVVVQCRNDAALRLRAPSRVLAHNEWLAAPALYESLVAFVQPRAAGVQRVLRAASDLLLRETGSGALQGYQEGQKRAAQIGAAVYEALRAEQLTYLEMPASFEETGQKIRTTAAVLRERFGNCVDLSVTYAACLEETGLHPLLWIVDGHAFAGFFSSEQRMQESVTREAASMINVVESGRAVAVELTGLGPGNDSVPFALAVRHGRGHLRGRSRLLGMVDVHLARRSGIRPLPSSDAVPAETASTPEPMSQEGFALPDDLDVDDVLEDLDGTEDNVAADTGDEAPPRVAAWRRSLLDLSLRNPLLKLPRNRGKGLDLHVPAGSLPLLDDLVHGGKPISIAAQDALGGMHELQGVRRAQDLPDDVVARELEEDHRVYGAVSEVGYVRRMRGLQREARTLQQEMGGNYLYLTLGALVHPTPTGEAHAPLFLLPIRIEGGAGRRPYTALVDGDEVAATNHCLVHWLRVKHGVRIRELETPILDESGIDIAASFRAIRKAMLDAELGYRIDETASLRILQFSTFQMWRDLTEHWETFLANPVVSHLVERAGTPMANGAAPPGANPVHEGDLHLPIAADGSQMRAVSMAEQGHSFVLEGPPGTGKSQTITNLIAHAVGLGKTVLFVAEKQAALDVVKRRLAQVGLENFCLDLHGRKQSARSIHRQLKAALEQRAAGDEPAWQALTARYRAVLSPLERYPERVHGPNRAGFSAWEAYSAVVAHGDGPRAVIAAGYFSLPDQHRAAADTAASELPTAAGSARLGPGHPWRISGRRDLEGLTHQGVTAIAAELEDTRQQLARLPEALRYRVVELAHPGELRRALPAAGLAATGRLPDGRRTEAAAAPGWDAAVAAAHDAVVTFQEQHRSALATFTTAWFEQPELTALRAQAAAAAKGLLGKKKRRAQLVEALRPYIAPAAEVDQTTVLDVFRDAAAAYDAATALAGSARAVPALDLGSTWSPAAPNAAERIQQRYRELACGRDLYLECPHMWRALAGSDSAVQADLLERLVGVWDRWLDALGTTDREFAEWSGELGWAATWQRDGATWYRELAASGLLPIQRWGVLLGHTDILEQCGLTEFARQVRDGAIPQHELHLAYLRGVASSALSERLGAGDLDYFDAGTHEQRVADYLRLARELRERVPNALSATLVSRRERHARAAGELVRRLNAHRDRLSFRDAFAAQPDVITSLTPCLLTSPASVANFLEPGAATFDLVVFDEASQIRVAQAVGAMGRARSVVVVGDSKQMPPTSVMEATGTEESEDTSIPEDLDSILAECVESGMHSETLTWHYRSTDESLIAFSNAHYYEGRLASLPAPGGDPTAGIFWRRVEGRFDRGASRTNRVEAEIIVEEIARLLSDPRTAGRSVGVVTFNVQQRDLLLNLLEESPDERIQSALARDEEHLFVKNLENVQGDERDVVLFSLAFSKDPDTGQLPLNFGPLSVQGGERRLNVAITRARTQITLFSSFDPCDIDLGRTSARGTHHLRAYLEFAARGVHSSGDVASRARRLDGVVEEIATELRDRQMEVERDFGLSDFTVDLAVRAPGAAAWQVAVLLDGPSWARRGTVADRDAAPVLLKTLMGWQAVVRIWLPEWIADRAAVLERIGAAVAAAPPEEPVSPEEAVSPEEPVPAEVQGPPEPEVTSPPRTGGEVRAAAAEPSPVPALGRIVTASPPAPEAPNPVTELFRPYVPSPAGSREQIDQLTDSPHVQQLARQRMAEAIETEGPIEAQRLARLVNQCFDLQRVVPARRDLMLRYLPERYRTTLGGGTLFVWPEHLEPASWRDFRRVTSSDDRAFEEIAPEEIANAMRHVLETHGTDSDEQLYRATREVLGYGRTGKHMEATLRRVLRWGVDSGRLPGPSG